MNCSKYLNHTYEEAIATSGVGDYEGQYDSKNNGGSNGNKMDKLLVRPDAVYKNSVQARNMNILLINQSFTLLGLALVLEFIK